VARRRPRSDRLEPPAVRLHGLAGALDLAPPVVAETLKKVPFMVGVPEKAPGICSEQVCRVPMLWRVPGVTPAGHESNALVENIDLPGTLTSLCGLPPMESTDGKDLSALLAGEGEAVRDVAVTENAWSKSMRWGKYRFVYYDPDMFDEPMGELYDLERDPNETRNLFFAPDHAGLVERCRHALLTWLIRTTRVTTAQPRPPEGYRIAGDNKESNLAGPASRLAQGRLNYL